jgi:hypothetical protein
MIFNENEVDPALVQAMVDGLEEPNVLHSLKGVPMRTPVSAIRLGRRGSDPRDNIPINWQLGPDGTVGWWGMTNAASRAMGVEMSSHFLAPVLPLIQDHHAVGFEKIVAGLGLADFEPTRQLSEGILRFLREPTTRLRLPNGRAVPRIPVKSPPLVSSTAAAGT